MIETQKGGILYFLKFSNPEIIRLYFESLHSWKNTWKLCFGITKNAVEQQRTICLKRKLKLRSILFSVSTARIIEYRQPLIPI